MSIPFSQLPTIPDSDIRGITQLAAQTTDSNGVAYTGTVTVDQLFNDGGTGCVCVQVASLVIPSAQVLTGNSTPIPFGINVPAGYYAKVLGCDGKLTYVSAAYATNTTIHILADVGASTEYMFRSTTLLLQTGNTFNPFQAQAGTSTPNIIVNGDIYFMILGGDPTAGDSDITLYLTYLLIQA